MKNFFHSILLPFRTLLVNRYTVWSVAWAVDRTVRRFFNLVYNGRFHRIILSSEVSRLKVAAEMKRILEADTEDEVMRVYSGIYEGYEDDHADSGVLKGMQGFPDWSPSITTMLFKDRDDCDGMAVVWSHLGRRYCLARGYGVMNIGAYSHIYYGRGMIRAFSEMHVMGIAKVESPECRFVLFDYKTVNRYRSLDEIREYYADKYIAGKLGEAERRKVCIVRLLEPKPVAVE